MCDPCASVKARGRRKITLCVINPGNKTLSHFCVGKPIIIFWSLVWFWSLIFFSSKGVSKFTSEEIKRQKSELKEHPWSSILGTFHFYCSRVLIANFINKQWLSPPILVLAGLRCLCLWIAELLPCSGGCSAKLGEPWRGMAAGGCIAGSEHTERLRRTTGNVTQAA